MSQLKPVSRGELDRLNLQETVPQFLFHTTPLRHQLDEFLRSCDEEIRAIFWEQGTGKTKYCIDLAAWLWLRGEIDAVIVVAPNSVHRNWVSDELPEHLLATVDERSVKLIYQAAAARTQRQQRAVKRLLEHEGLSWLALSYDAFMTKAGKQLMWKVLQRRRCLYVLDESAHIKTPGIKRTKSIVASGRYARYKRILSGTPVTNSPYDVYTQVKFLDEKYWRRHGIGSAQAFRNEFGVFQHGFNRQTQKEYQTTVGYKNLDKLQSWLASISSRVLKSDVLDLPPKSYTRRYFSMNPEQRRLYRELTDDFRAELSSGEKIKTPIVLTRLLRLQQITCGYLPSEREDSLVPLGDNNPRLELLEEILSETSHQGIIWARFTQDVDLIMDLLGDSACRFDGRVDEEERAISKRAFQAGDKQWFVSKAQVGGEGLTLTQAGTVIYYNNTFRLKDRLQSEDRAHRIGLEHPVLYVDMLAEGTIDQHILQKLALKLDVASRVTGDEVREWL